MKPPNGRLIVIILDSVGIGELPDADQYGDIGSNTLRNLGYAVGGLQLPNFEALGLGKISPLPGLSDTVKATAAYGLMAEKAPGKDSITGHWELMGHVASRAQPTYPEGFPARIVNRLREETGHQYIGNYPASGTEIIKELGGEHVRTGEIILYTSADSVLQLAAHEEIVPLDELYEICRTARRIMDGKDAVGRIIARPFVGEEGNFVRTTNRKDFALQAPDNTVLDLLIEAGIEVLGIGKIDDLFGGRGLSEVVHTKSNMQGLEETTKAIQSERTGLIFTNLVDFDMLWGHRNDPDGYYSGLREVDQFLPTLLEALKPEDMLIFTADHGCDPTTISTDHSREYVPIIIYGKSLKPDVDIGVRKSFADLGASIADYFGIRGTGAGVSFLPQIYE
ncbi:phosphopentomutase [candidate division LCP-89 bacterium B3_LCP]|uniref:Phosphopentomutase n=1 Tax=candidate division LCP-89 bacterium B3_LCP TaxID=2012998 RepID=A0A532UY10_UNCL8|nr:MAG: phosphopentomutase [candidate division LCP-89 bacterium B3_LCP]